MHASWPFIEERERKRRALFEKRASVASGDCSFVRKPKRLIPFCKFQKLKLHTASLSQANKQGLAALSPTLSATPDVC